MTKTEPSGKRVTLKSLGFVVGILLLAYVLKPLAESPVTLITQIQPGLLFAAFLLLLLHTLIVWAAWHYSLGLLGHALPVRITSPVFFGSMLSRYLPGGIWHIVGRLGIMRKFGIGTFNISVSITIEQVAGLTLSLLLGSSLLLYSELPAEQFRPGILALLGVTGLLLFTPMVMNRLLQFIASKVNNRSAPPKLSFHGIASFLSIHILALATFSAGYLAIVSAADGSAATASYQFAVSYIGVTLLATFAGFITPFVPGGLGVREAILLGWLSTSLSPETASLAAILPRLLLIISETLLFLVFLPGLWLKNRHE